MAAYNFNSGTATNTFGFGGEVFIHIVQQPPTPPCSNCGQPSVQSIEQYGPQCNSCGNYLAFFLSALGMFMHSPPDLRGSLYKRLSLVFHPDAGCKDPKFMELLNTAKERVG